MIDCDLSEAYADVPEEKRLAKIFEDVETLVEKELIFAVMEETEIRYYPADHIPEALKKELRILSLEEVMTWHDQVLDAMGVASVR